MSSGFIHDDYNPVVEAVSEEGALVSLVGGVTTGAGAGAGVGSGVVTTGGVTSCVLVATVCTSASPVVGFTSANVPSEL
jgi:hypothetical protein